MGLLGRARRWAGFAHGVLRWQAAALACLIACLKFEQDVVFQAKAEALVRARHSREFSRGLPHVSGARHGGFEALIE